MQIVKDFFIIKIDLHTILVITKIRIETLLSLIYFPYSNAK